MNPHIGDMRRMREFKEAFIVKHTDRKKRPIEPELRDIPLTRFDCDASSLYIDSTGHYRKCEINQSGLLTTRKIVDCKEWCENGLCLRGFPA